MVNVNDAFDMNTLAYLKYSKEADANSSVIGGAAVDTFLRVPFTVAVEFAWADHMFTSNCAHHLPQLYISINRTDMLILE